MKISLEMFFGSEMIKIVIPFTPQFFYLKLGFNGVFVHEHVFLVRKRIFNETKLVLIPPQNEGGLTQMILMYERLSQMV